MAKDKKPDKAKVKSKKVKPPEKTDMHKIKKVERFVLMKYTLYASIGGYSAGSVAQIICHKKTLIPKDRYWRKRLRDAKVDNCMVPYVEEILNKDTDNDI